MLCTDKTGLIIPTLLSVMLHEVGHLFIMWVCDCPPVSIKLIIGSVQIVKKPFINDNISIAISLAGPFFNLAFALFLILNYLIYSNRFILLFAVTNVILCLFNLLPVCGLDGGEVLFILLSKRHSLTFSQNAVRVLSAIIAVLFLCLGFYFYKNGTVNISAFILALYLFVSAVIIKE